MAKKKVTKATEEKEVSVLDEYHFSGDEATPAVTIKASSLAEATDLYNKNKQAV